MKTDQWMDAGLGIRLRGWILALGLPVASFAVQAAPPDPPEDPLFKPGVFHPAALCGKCHEDIFRAWSEESVHARSMTDPAFQASLGGLGPEVRSSCMMCHAPTVILTGDQEGKQDLTREGVTCDFCHSLKGVDLGRKVPFDLDVGRTKRGPLRNPGVAPHGVEFSELHTSALLCASCHEYRNRHGVAVLSTYSEWQAGEVSKRGLPCQGCHMEIYQARMVAGQRTDDISRNFINLHEVPGGRSLRQLKRALDLEITGFRSADGRTRVEVEVANRGAGHQVPTGLSNHRVVLEVRVTSGGRVEKKERVYQRILADETGKRIDEVARLFTDAAGVQSDNRIAPGEVRQVRFDFPPVKKGDRIEALLIYEALPGWPGAEKRSVEFRRVEKAIP